MENQLSQTSVLIHQLQQDLTAYENATDRLTEQQTYQIVQNRIQNLLEQVDRLDILVNKEPAQRRAQSRQHVNEIKYDLRHYQVRCFFSVRSTLDASCPPFRPRSATFRHENNSVKKRNDSANRCFVGQSRRIGLR